MHSPLPLITKCTTVLVKISASPALLVRAAQDGKSKGVSSLRSARPPTIRNLDFSAEPVRGKSAGSVRSASGLAFICQESNWLVSTNRSNTPPRSRTGMDNQFVGSDQSNQVIPIGAASLQD